MTVDKIFFKLSYSNYSSLNLLSLGFFVFFLKLNSEHTLYPSLVYWLLSVLRIANGLFKKRFSGGNPVPNHSSTMVHLNV